MASALGYLVPVLGARTLPAADLGALATVLAIAGIVAVPSMGLQIAVAVRRAKQPGASAARAGWLTAVVCTVTVAVTAPIAGPSLDLPVTVILLLAVYTGAIVLAGRWLGELQGDERFLPLAAGMAVQAVGRYGGLSAGLLLNAGLTGSMLIGTASALLIPAALAWLARPENGNAADPTRPEDGSATGLARPESGSATGLARSESGSASGPARSES
ncbi:MAG TPA: polysaccharide biosynthesis protein, partial [Actinoplanes sp.]|nr:polysaccharide biosynthesis protein [Actinoplanes sp.]